MLQTGSEFLLKRPFSIFSHRGGLLYFLYCIRGKGTKRLSELREGDFIEVLGPLGKAYPKPAGDFIALAGGSGIASIYCLLEDNKGKGHLFYGAKEKGDIVLADSLEKVSKVLTIATEDGSLGVKGNALEALCSKYQGDPPMPIYACGPKQMLMAVSRWALDKGLPCYISLEEHMACGVGACLSCVVETREGLKGICKDGPIFSAGEIIGA